MKKLTLITLLAVPALLLAAPIAQAGNGHCCGEGRNGGSYRPYWDIYRIAVRTAVSDQPYYGAGTDVMLRAGSVVRARCFYNEGRRWCKIKSESIARAFVPRRCLERLGDEGYSPSWYRYRRHHDNGRYENGYYFNGDGNGNGHHNGAHDYNGDRNGYGNGNGHYNGNGNGDYNGADYYNGNGNGNGYRNGYGNGRRIRSDGLNGYPWTDYPYTRDDGFGETNGYRRY